MTVVLLESESFFLPPLAPLALLPAPLLPAAALPPSAPPAAATALSPAVMVMVPLVVVVAVVVVVVVSSHDSNVWLVFSWIWPRGHCWQPRSAVAEPLSATRSSTPHILLAVHEGLSSCGWNSLEESHRPHSRLLVSLWALVMYSPAKHVLILPHSTFSPAFLVMMYWPRAQPPCLAHTRSLLAVGPASSYSSPSHSCTSWHLSSWWIFSAMNVLPLHAVHVLDEGSRRCPAPHFRAVVVVAVVVVVLVVVVVMVVVIVVVA